MSNTNKATQLSREELYNLVWLKPVSKILQDYPISQTTFRSVCKEHNIPLPKNGYWSKLKYNVPVEIIELPNPSNNYVISIGDSCNSNSNSPQAKLNQLKKELESDLKLKFTV